LHRKDTYIVFKNPAFLIKSWCFKHYLSLQEKFLQNVFGWSLDHLCGMWRFDVPTVSVTQRNRTNDLPIIIVPFTIQVEAEWLLHKGYVVAKQMRGISLNYSNNRSIICLLTIISLILRALYILLFTWSKAWSWSLASN
jgi:hypothetical protein